MCGGRTGFEHGGDMNASIFLSCGEHCDYALETAFASGSEDVQHACAAHVMVIEASRFVVRDKWPFALELSQEMRPR
jgi:hypothetical protein